ncbi:MAG: ATP synthase F0 subunit B [Deltaproteobacteria bacterium]|nr:ATP synthase F0 subunit B [Deltaproteobacteria bacterium]
MKRLLSFSTLLMLIPTAALAASEGMGQVWEVINLLLLIGVLVYFARKPVLAFLGERREEIQTNLASSEKLLSDAETRLKEWNEKAAQLEREIQNIRESAQRAAERERDTIIADAEETAARIRTGAGSVVDRELRAARESLREEVADLATELAGKILRDKVGDEDRSRLVDEFIEKIEQGERH